MSFMETFKENPVIAYADLPYFLGNDVKRLQLQFGWPDEYVRLLNLRLRGTKAEDIARAQGRALGTIGEKLMKIRNDLGIKSHSKNPFINAQILALAILRMAQPLDTPEIAFTKIVYSHAAKDSPGRVRKKSRRPEDRRQAPDVPMPDRNEVKAILVGIQPVDFEILTARMEGEGVANIGERVGMSHQVVCDHIRAVCKRWELPQNRDRGPGSAALHAADLRLAAWRRINGSRSR